MLHVQLVRRCWKKFGNDEVVNREHKLKDEKDEDVEEENKGKNKKEFMVERYATGFPRQRDIENAKEYEYDAAEDEEVEEESFGD